MTKNLLNWYTAFSVLFHFATTRWRCVLEHESLVLTLWIAALYEDSPPSDQLAVQAEVMRLMAAPQHVAGQPAPLPRLPS